MTVEPPPDFREEVDIVRIDPLFLERQRNRYAGRGVAFLVILNGIAALILLNNFLRLHPQVENAPTVAAAMVANSGCLSRSRTKIKVIVESTREAIVIAPLQGGPQVATGSS